LVIGNARYTATQDAGLFLKQARYPFFVGHWIVILLLLSIILPHLYAWTRGTLGPGPAPRSRSAFSWDSPDSPRASPDNFGQAAWSPINLAFPLGWMLDMWIGSILAALVAGFLYQE
jgi:hypothetical protein